MDQTIVRASTLIGEKGQPSDFAGIAGFDDPTPLDPDVEIITDAFAVGADGVWDDVPVCGCLLTVPHTHERDAPALRRHQHPVSGIEPGIPYRLILPRHDVDRHIRNGSSANAKPRR